MEKDQEQKPAETNPQASAGTPSQDKNKDQAEASAKTPETDRPAPAPDKPAASPPAPVRSANPIDTATPIMNMDSLADKPASSADDTVKTHPPQIPPAPPPDPPKPLIPELAMTKPGTGSLPGSSLMGQPQMGPGGQLLDRRATYRRWLESKTKDDLIELIMGLEKEQPALEVTEKMMKVQLTGPLASPSEGFKIPEDLPFLRLPVVRQTPANEPTPTWRIVLVSLEQNNKPVGLIVDSEITIGRTAGGATPDLDLTPFGASLKGVSRIHAKIRPTMHSLALIDNNSSNGTYCNRSRIAPGTEQPLKEGDVIAFGQAYFLVRVIKSPDTTEAKTLI